jgi:hypothetical protein
MADYKNLPLGLRTQTQIPLDIKEYSINELLLSNLGVNGQLAYTYTKGLIIYCIEEGTRWEWKEVESGLEDTGLINNDFIYPDGHIAFGIDYSNKRYNFFQAISDGSETKITAGDNISVLGNGTVNTPYIISLTGETQDFQGVTDNGNVTTNEFYRNYDLGEAAGFFGVFNHDIGIKSYQNIEDVDTIFKSLTIQEENYSGELYFNYKIEDGVLPTRNLRFNLPIKNNPSYPALDTYTLATTADLRPYKVYTAIIHDVSGTPTPIILENSIGTISFSGTVNEFSLSSSGLFILNKTFINTEITYDGEDHQPINSVRKPTKTANLIEFTNSSDTSNYEIYIEIRVYN